jgi:hypothetical protein
MRFPSAVYLQVVVCCCNKEGHSPEQLGNGFWFLLYRTAKSSMLLHKTDRVICCPDDCRKTDGLAAICTVEQLDS